jgi:branched-chain amino acid transport system substrate-binding protein
VKRCIGVWWAGAEPDVKDVGPGAKGYNAIMMQHGAEPNAAVVKEVLEKVHGKGQGTGPKDEVGQVLYMRGLQAAMLAVEGVRAAQERFGKGKWVSPEQARWGYENLNLTQAKLDALGFKGVMRPISTSCQDHMGASWARVHTWDGTKFEWTSDWLQGDEQIHQADGQGSRRQVRRREEADPPLTGGLPELSPSLMGQHLRAGPTGSTVSLDEWLALLATHPMKGSQCGPFHWVNKADS